MTKFYPKAAADAHVEGRATLRCSVTAAGGLADCTTSGEDPPGQGFGEAALNLAPLFKMRPMTKDGVPVSGGKINIPIRFALPKAPTVTLEAALECYGTYASAAEREPSAQDIQLAAFGWRVVVEALSVPEKLRPSELEGRLTAAQRMGATPAAAQAPALCKQMMTERSMQSLQGMVRSVAGGQP
jgi:TonB family protein